jgi:leucyl/phenylalanyl-tRNA---protein transferase
LAAALHALYRQGAFPMAQIGRRSRSAQIDWFEADPRAMLPLTPQAGLHVPRRLARTIRQMPYTITTDTAFERVVRFCARPDRPGPWIDGQIIGIACLLHRAGHAHSIEAWDDQQRLVGGLYGVSIPGRSGPIFCAESMVTDFALGPDAGKICLIYLARHLSAMGYSACDVQMANPHTRQFGVYEITREEYRSLLPPFDHAPVEPCPWAAPGEVAF